MDREQFMKRCYELAIRAGKKGFDTFGAVLVHNGKILRQPLSGYRFERIHAVYKLRSV